MASMGDIPVRIQIGLDASKIGDGFHTMQELYDFRSVLAACVFNVQPTAEKSRLHEDGSMFDGMFIAYFQTMYGTVSFHFENKWWDFLRIKEVKRARKWDGHTSDDVMTALCALASGM